jgi:hypothetical protein
LLVPQFVGSCAKVESHDVKRETEAAAGAGVDEFDV